MNIRIFHGQSGFASMIILLATVSSTTFADPPQPAGGQGVAGANSITEFKGTLQGFQNGIVLVKRDDGKDTMVKLPVDVNAFTFNADVKRHFLQRGMAVRFLGTFAPNGSPTAPVTEIEVFQPVNIKAVRGHYRDRFTPGVHTPGAPVHNNKNAKKPVAIAEYRVVGTLMGLTEEGVITVQAGQIPVTTKLTEDASILVRYNNLSLAKEGDAVSVVGFYNPPDETKILADKITITTDRDLSGPVEPVKPQRKTRRGRKPATDKKADPDAAKPPAEGPGQITPGEAALDK